MNLDYIPARRVLVTRVSDHLLQQAAFDVPRYIAESMEARAADEIAEKLTFRCCKAENTTRYALPRPPRQSFDYEVTSEIFIFDRHELQQFIAQVRQEVQCEEKTATYPLGVRFA